MNWFLKLFKGDDWKVVFAWIVVYGYAYDVIIWPFTFWMTTIGTSATGTQWPGPPLVPWEQLAVMTVNLGVIGTVQLFKDRDLKKTRPSTESEVVTKTKTVK